MGMEHVSKNSYSIRWKKLQVSKTAISEVAVAQCFHAHISGSCNLFGANVWTEGIDIKIIPVWWDDKEVV